MANITLRQGSGNTEPRLASANVKNAVLTSAELDNNFNNLNNEANTKLGTTGSVFIGNLSADKTVGETVTSNDFTVLGQNVSALHRSPNAITAMYIYDTSKDSDGGAWTEKCQHTSWYNETICGKWLGAHPSELSARCFNAVLGTETVTNGTFTTDLTGWTASAGASSVSGELNLVTSSATDVTCKQTLTTVNGTNYVLTFTKVSAPGTSTDLSVIVGTSDGGTQLLNVANIGDVAAGTYTYAFTAASSTSYLRFTNSTNTAATVIIDSVSVKPVTTQVATTNDYFQLTTDGKFYALNAGSGTTEVFRGNKRAFPKLAAIVAESNNVTIYDLTEVGRPMWMRFNKGATNTSLLSWANNTGQTSALSALSGKLFIGSSASNSAQVDFAKDDMRLAYPGGGQFLRDRKLVSRNSQSGAFVGSGGDGFSIAQTSVNAVAMTVLPDAPVDPVTGLKVPTIAVGTGTGISVIKHNGTVVSSSASNSFSGINITPYLLSASRSNASWHYALNPGSLSASFGLTSVAGEFGRALGSALLRSASRERFAASTGALVSHRRNSEADTARSLNATITNTFNTGWLSGDIRRAYLSSNAAGSVTGPELVSNVTFADTTGWSAPSGYPSILSAVNNELVITNNGVNYGTAVASISTVIGKSYTLTATVRAGSTLSTANLVAATNYATLYPNLIASVAGKTETTSKTNVVLSGTFVATTTTTFVGITNSNQNNATSYVSSFSAKEVIPDRSYKAAGANINGTLTATAVNTGNDLVAYSGFSANNYIREPYSADLDFGTGEWSCSAWVNTTQPAEGGNLLTYSEQFDNATWLDGLNRWTATANTTASPDSTTTADTITADGNTNPPLVEQIVSVSPITYTFSVSVKKSNVDFARLITVSESSRVNGTAQWFNISSGTKLTGSNFGSSGPTFVSSDITDQSGGWYRLSLTAKFPTASTDARVIVAFANTENGTVTTGDAIYIWGAQLNLGSNSTTYIATTSANSLPVGSIMHRSFSSGPEIKLQMTHTGTMQAVSYDGTTTRTVTTTADYNSNTWIKVGTNYVANGDLSIMVNGIKVANTGGSPLLSANNANAVFTIGNNYNLDSPFPGSIALVKVSGTVPTTEQSTFMYEQEKHLFTANAKCVLPSSTNVLDLSYDDKTDTWTTVQAGQESTWSGLVRTANNAPQAGSFSRCSTGSGVKLLARTTTTPGVDITIPSKNLKSKDTIPNKNQDIVIFDYDGVASQNTFPLPVGYTARTVYVDRLEKQEGSTKDWTRLYDGFVESVLFGTAPGANTWIQIQATKEIT